MSPNSRLPPIRRSKAAANVRCGRAGRALMFRHSCIYVRAGAGITTPQDLKGKRVGTSQWSSTGLVFMRGMLQHDYGVYPQDMHWFIGGLNTFVEPPLIPLDLPKDIRLDFLSGWLAQTISLRPAWNDYALSGLLRKREPRRA
jgi:NMT1/THI5 like